MNSHTRWALLLALFFPVLLSSCAGTSEIDPGSNYLAYRASADNTELERYQPVFVIEDPAQEYNRIGTVQATFRPAAAPFVFVDADQATVYGEVRRFTTGRDSYTNLIYRVHFERVPFSLLPFHLGWGENVGLIVVVTLNGAANPVLYTTVHTCGCYLAFVPTSILPDEALPGGWNREIQSVYGEFLPGLLDGAAGGADWPDILVFVRGGTHRVMDLRAVEKDSPERFTYAEASLKSLRALERIPVEAHGTTSFFEEAGSRRGYVKRSTKVWERLLMSWWALDWRVGEDKKLGRDSSDGPVFYTSLKPWDRMISDMRDFRTFLDYWGWGL